MTLTPFRVASLFCRALAFWLWWSAGLGFVALLLNFVLSAVFGVSFGLIGGAFQGALPLLGSLGAALVLSLFNAGLSAAMTGRGAFDEETIRTSSKPLPEERALVVACGGLLLLVDGALSFGQMSFFVVFGVGFGGGLMSLLALPILEVGLGLGFAFRFGLKRLLPK